MAEVLVIRLKGNSPATLQAEWLLVDSAGSRLGNVESGPLTAAVPAAGGRSVIVLVPGTDVLLAEPELPVKSGARVAQVVPFALEEQLASDVEDMHFAVGRREARPGTPVAAVALTAMDTWLGALKSAGISPSAMYSESAAVPLTPNGVTLVVEGVRIHVRRADVPAAVVEAEPLIEGLQLALASGDETRENVSLFLSQADYERDRDMIEGLREFTASLQVKLLTEGPLALLAVTIVKQSGTNLLQGPYAVAGSMSGSLAPWRYAAMLAGAFVVVHLGVKGVQFWKLGAEEARLDSQIAAVFSQAMPGTRQVNARTQVEGRLAQLRGNGVAGGLMTSLGTLGQAIAQAPETSVEALSYRADVLDLRVLAPSVDALDRIQHAATERGMNAVIQSATPRDSKVEGRLQFKTTG
ncbi:MAG: type II secretion system protein GspL [Steroidobacteraceae bacterium]